MQTQQLTWDEAVIHFDELTKQYNYPFKVKYLNGQEWQCAFYFRDTDFACQEDMLRARLAYCSKSLFGHFMGVFEQLQEICLDDGVEASDALVDTINGLFGVLLHLFVVFSQMYPENVAVPHKLCELFEELKEMFILLADYYTIERKKELYEWKDKMIQLEANMAF
jgi:hypothetical protein